jgi:hypothetical protein
MKACRYICCYVQPKGPWIVRSWPFEVEMLCTFTFHFVICDVMQVPSDANNDTGSTKVNWW